MFGASVGATLAFGTVLFQLVTKDATLLLYSSLTLSAIIMLVTYFFIPESPKFLHATRQYDKCRTVMSQIARVNSATTEI